MESSFFLSDHNFANQKKKKPTEKPTNYLTTSALNTLSPSQKNPQQLHVSIKALFKELFFIAEGSGTLGHGVDRLEPCPQYGGRAKLGTQLCRQPHHRQCGEGRVLQTAYVLCNGTL